MTARRSFASRLVTALLGSWFVVLVAEPAAAMHRCPMHDGYVQQAVQHSSHGTHSKAPAHAGHACTCVGDCSAAGMQFTLPLAEFRFGASTARTFVAVASHDEVVRATASDHLRPYPTAPPVTAL